MKLNKNAKKWVKALRSKEFRQTRGQLKGKFGHCCLGVACEVAMKEGVIDSYDGAQGNLPEKVQNWLGLKNPDGDFYEQNGYQKGLVEYNDRSKYNFEKIADLIEKHADKLFIEE